MEDLFQEAAGWELVSAQHGSPHTLIHILRRYNPSQTIQKGILYAFKTITVSPPTTTNRLISNQSITIKYKDASQIKTEIKAFQKLKPYRAIIELYQVISQSDHDPNIRDFFRQFLKERDHKGIYVSLILQFGSMGSLSSYLAKHSFLSFQNLLKIAWEICQCLLCLKKHGILHRDLRTNNLLITENGLKLTDFDSAFIKELSGIDDLSVSLHLQTSAPQLLSLLQKSYDQKQRMSSDQLFDIQQKCDIFSFGAIMFQLLTGEEFKKQKKELIKIASLQKGKLAHLTLQMLEEDHKKRIELNEIASTVQVIAKQAEIQIASRPVEEQKSITFPIPVAIFPSSTLSKSQSNSLSLSDWSLEEIPQLYRKKVEHSDLLFPESPQPLRFSKLQMHNTFDQ